MAIHSDVEDILSALDDAGLGDVAMDLRLYLEGGITMEPSGTLPRDGLDWEDDPPQRRRSREEQIDAAFEFINEELIRPVELIEEAEVIAGELGQGRGPRRIDLLDTRFEDSEPYPAMTEEQRIAAKRLGRIIPMLRESMLLERRGELDGR